MDAVLLSRIQFAVNAGFHFLFPPITLGLTLIIAIVEFKFYRSKEEGYKTISGFLIKVLGLVFALGVATGIVLEFAFGTNWANYSRMVGDIFGAPLAAEGIFAFFLESVFIGVLLYGRNRVSPRLFLLSTFIVFFASHLSGLWIIIANSWMHTPAGYEMVQGRAEMTDFFAAVFNPSMVQRYLHTVVGAWITGSLFTAGIAAWYLLKQRSIDYAGKLLNLALVIFCASALLQFGTGHAHAVQVARTHPERMASYEALWNTQQGAPMSLIGIPDREQKTTHFEIRVPKLLSFMINFDPNSTVRGLNEFPESDLPPLLTTYFSYHVMIGLGSLFAFLGLLGMLFVVTKSIGRRKWYLWILVFLAPLPLVANEVGWIAAEVGRQPWAVYRVLRTIDAVSVTLTPGEVLFSLIGFSLIYAVLLVFFILFLFKIVRNGMENVKAGY